MLHEDFKIFAEENGVPINGVDEVEWYKFWCNGFNSAIELYSQWYSGERFIGAMQTNIKDILRPEGK
jgi:hypothetical protein